MGRLKQVIYIYKQEKDSDEGKVYKEEAYKNLREEKFYLSLFSDTTIKVMEKTVYLANQDCYVHYSKNKIDIEKVKKDIEKLKKNKLVRVTSYVDSTGKVVSKELIYTKKTAKSYIVYKNAITVRQYKKSEENKKVAGNTYSTYHIYRTGQDENELNDWLELKKKEVLKDLISDKKKELLNVTKEYERLLEIEKGLNS